MKRSAVVLLAALVVAVPALGARSTPRARDAVTSPGKTVEVMAAFGAASSGKPFELELDNIRVGAGTIDASGLARLSIAAPANAGRYTLHFAIDDSTWAASTLCIFDASRPALLVDVSALPVGPGARDALVALAARYDIIYVNEGPLPEATRQAWIAGDFPRGPLLEIRPGATATFARNLLAKGVHAVAAIASTPQGGLAYQSAGLEPTVAPRRFDQVATRLLDPKKLATFEGSDDQLRGVWQVVDSARGEIGTLALDGADGTATDAFRSVDTFDEKGTVSYSQGSLQIDYARDVHRGIHGILDATGHEGTTNTFAQYRFDPVEGSFTGDHEGNAESLRRATGGNAIELLVDGREMLPAYLSAIAGAQRSIHIESYIWKDDETGNHVVDALCARATAGVAVRAIFDGSGSMRARELRNRLTQAGAVVVNYNPVSFANAGAFLTSVDDFLQVFRKLGNLRTVDPAHAGGIDHRDHRKVLIVDGRMGFVGGIGFSDDDVKDWHDIQARLRGPAVARLQRHFLESWTAGGGAVDEPKDALYPSIPVEGKLAVDVPTEVPGVRTEIKRVYLARIAAARTEILIENPYLSDDEILNALRSAAKRGVHVSLVLPDDNANDVKFMGSLHARIRPGLAALGIDVRSYPKMCHGKVAIIDGRWATVGSCNLDNRSLVRNLEVNISVDDPSFAEDMRARIFTPDIKLSRPYSPADKPTGFLKKLMGAFANLARDLL